MQQALIIFSLVLFSLYSLLLLYYRLAWDALPDYSPDSSDQAPTSNQILNEAEGQAPTLISIIIPARNEENNIAACLYSVYGQTYPSHLFEVLVVDDHSTDRTAEIVNGFPAENVKLISLKDHITGPELNSYKKKAIEVAIQHSTGKLIVTTDADCIVPANWLQTIARFYEERDPLFIVMPVSYNCNNSLLEKFQALDFMVLQGITGAAADKKMLSMCNGANLAYNINAFYEVEGFKGIDNVASGDDMLLMHKIHKKFPGRISYLRSKEVIVQTPPMHTWQEFFNQRIRWASKADQYDDKRIFAVLLLAYFFNVLLVVLPVMAIFNNAALHLSPFPVTIDLSLFEGWILLLILKTIIELYFLFPVARFFNKQKLLWLFPLMQPIHIIYTIIAGWLGKFGSYKWKGRKVN